MARSATGSGAPAGVGRDWTTLQILAKFFSNFESSYTPAWQSRQCPRTTSVLGSFSWKGPKFLANPANPCKSSCSSSFSCSSASTSSFLFVFGPNLAPSWPPKSVQEGSKSLQKCIQICILVLIPFLIDFWWILVDFGSQNAPKMEPSWLPRAMKTATSENTKIIKKPLVFSMILVVSGGRS